MNLVQGNLNEGTNGQYVYLGFTQTSVDFMALNDIKAVYGGAVPDATKTINGRTYKLFGYDANLGVNWSPIWLYAAGHEYGQNPLNPAGTPIKNLFVEIDGDLTGRTGTGWERVKFTDGSDAELNLGTTGSIIYLWMRR